MLKNAMQHPVAPRFRPNHAKVNAIAIALTMSLSACSNTGLQAGSVQPRPVQKPLDALGQKGWELSSDEYGAVSAASHWTLTGAPVAVAGRSEIRDPLFASVVSAGSDGSELKWRTTAQLQCYAREQAAFWQAHQREPNAVLERYMAGACGLWGFRPMVARKSIALEHSGSVRSEFRLAFADLPEQGMLGINARQGADSRMLLTLVYDVTPVQFEPVPTVAPGKGKLQFSGKASNLALTHGLATKGRYSWNDCRVPLPSDDAKVSAVCRYSPEDEVSFISISGHYTDNTAAPEFRIVAFGEQGVLTSYPPRPFAKTYVTHPQDYSGNLLNAVNEARRRAGTYRIDSDTQLGIRIDEWWRKDDKEEIKREFFRTAGRYMRSDTTFRPLVFASFILPADLNAGEAVTQALALPNVRAVMLNSRIESLAVRQYRVEGRDAIETVVAAFVRR